MNILDAFTTLTNPTTWVRVGLFGVALVLLIVGFSIAATGGQQ
jgi:hypothetical protein